MSMSISSSTSAASAMMFSRTGGARQRPDASQMADDLFSKLDTQNKGYLESSDLASALGSNSSSTSSASAEEVFKSLDSDSDGKLTKTELSDGLKKVQDQLESSFQAMRTKGKGDMPPPPPPQGGNGDADSDTDSSSTSSSQSASYDPADTNKDGTVSATEALAYALSNSSSTSSSSDASTSSSSTDTTASNTDIANALASMMQNVLQPGQAEGAITATMAAARRTKSLTADQMTEIASKTDDSDLASLMKTLASNFDAADANGDGKVTHDEAMAYQEQNQATGAATTASASSTSSASALDENVVKQIMQLVQTSAAISSRHKVRWARCPSAA
ncbi:MAG: EF-hand domain-containing protein [Rivihabitans pingtungensis]